MAFFKDLSVCDYFDAAAELPTLLAAGWLERGHSYAEGDPGSAVRRRLREFRRGRWQPVLFLGEHECDLCSEDGAYSYTNIFIPGPGVTYVAPEGIEHYVARHKYHPPREFCDALLAAPPVDSREYFESLKALGWSAGFFDEKLIREHSAADESFDQLTNARPGNVLFAPEPHELQPSNSRLQPTALTAWVTRLRKSMTRPEAGSPKPEAFKDQK